MNDGRSTTIFQPASSPGRHRAWKLLPVVWLATCLALVSLGCKTESGKVEQQPRALEVSVVDVVTQDVPVTLQYVAQVESSRQVNIQARVNGFLDRRVYTEGSIVKEGETLFVMDQKPFKVQLAQAKAALARHEAALTTARQNLARVKPLSAANALSQKDLDEATGQFETTAAAVEQAKATVEEAKLNLSYTVITSPVTGITSSARQSDGTYLNPSNSLLTTVAVISPIYVNFSISENEQLHYRNQVAKGLLVEPKDRNYVAEVVLDDGTVFSHTGQVTFADPSFNPQTGTFLIRATVDNPNGLLMPNQFVHIRLKGITRPNAILVPQRAVQQGAKGHFVWVASKEDKAEARPVVVGDWFGDDWIITEGLHVGDRVVADGGLTLRPGAPLQAKPLAGRAAAAATPAQAGK